MRLASLRSLERLPIWAILLLSLMLVAGVGALDYATGYDLAFSLFYLLPISLAAWLGGRGAGLVIAAIAAITWVVLDHLSGHELAYSKHAWNALIRLGFFLVTVLLLVALRRAFLRLEELARSDELTGLPNRRALRDLLEMEVQLARRSGRNFALAVFDLDGFKQVNDRHGHAEGDRVLVAVARSGNLALREGDLLARIGGDEFAVLMPETDAAEAARVMGRLQSGVRDAMARGGWATNLSTGLASFTVAPESPEVALARADELARRAKLAGKGRLLAAPADAESGAVSG